MKKQGIDDKNKRLGTLRQTIFIFLMFSMVILMLNFASGWEFDNSKSYDAQNKVATITNAFGLGEKIADVKLKTEQTRVITNSKEDYVFEYEIDVGKEQTYDLLTNTEVYYKKTMQKIENKNLILKYYNPRGEYQETINEYETKDCDKNGKACFSTIKDSYNVTKYGTWEEISGETILPVGKTIIRGYYPNMELGIVYEWIPTFFGIKVQEWATFVQYVAVSSTALTGAGSYTGISTTHTASGSDRYVVVTVLARNTSTGISSIDVKYDGTSLTYLNSTSNQYVNGYIFGGVPSTTSNALVTANWTNNQYQVVMGIQSFQNVDGNGSSRTNQSTAVQYMNTSTPTGYSTNDMYVDGILELAGGEYLTTTTGQTRTYYANVGGFSYAGSYKNATAGADSMGWDGGTTDVAIHLLTVIKGKSTVDTSPTVTLNSPIAFYNSTSKDLNLNCTATDDNLLENITLYLNNSVNGTNSSVYNNTATIFARSLADGYYFWNCGACDNATIPQCANATARYFWIDTEPTISIVSPPVNNSNFTSMNIDFEATSSLSVSYWIINFNGTNYTTANQEGTSLLESYNVADGSYRLLLYGNNSVTGIWGLNNSIYFNVDANAPVINITYPTQNLSYQAINTNFTFNWTVTDVNLDDCWYDYNGTNQTVTCGDNTTNINITNWWDKNLTFWANDTIGNENHYDFYWDYRLFFISETYSASALSGSSQSFSTLLITNGTDITIANLSYNGTGYLGSIAQSGNNFTITRNISTPTVTVDTNMSFFWQITQADGFVYNYTAKNQTLRNVGIDNCSINGNVLYNFTILNEELQSEINGTLENSLAQINLQLYSYGTSTLIQSFNSQYNQTNPFAVCFNNTFSSERYNLNAQVRYSADGYEPEFYHIQNATIQNSSFTTNISLYDLNTTNSQVFKLIYKDSSYLPVQDALIVIGRKYIDEGLFKNVEIPKTDVQGETVAHLQLNNVVYNFTIIKNNVILGTFDNVFAVCQTPLVSECIIEFNSFAGAVGVPDFDEESDFTYTLGYINTSRTIQSNFTLPSGTPATVLLEVSKFDALGTSICTDTLTSASGTLSCVVPASIGNSTIVATLYKNGYYQGWGSLKINQSPSDIYGTAIMVFLSIIILMTLGGLALSGNPIITIALLMVGVILMFALNLVANNGFIGSTATILFFIIACILLLIKGVKR